MLPALRSRSIFKTWHWPQGDNLTVRTENRYLKWQYTGGGIVRPTDRESTAAAFYNQQS